MGVLLGNDYLAKLSSEESQRSYLEAAEPTLEGSLAWLLHKAGIFKSSTDYDRWDERFADFSSRRSELHLKMLKDHMSLNPGAEALLRWVRDETAHGAAVASMASPAELEVIFNKFDLYDLIPNERIFNRDHVKHHKPHREINDRAFRSLETTFGWEQRQRIFGVDDSRGGVASIRGAGLFAIGLATNMPVERFIGTEAQIVVPDLNTVLLLAQANKNVPKGKQLVWANGRLSTQLMS